MVHIKLSKVVVLTPLQRVHHDIVLLILFLEPIQSASSLFFLPTLLSLPTMSITFSF